MSTKMNGQFPRFEIFLLWLIMSWNEDVYDKQCPAYLNEKDGEEVAE